MHVPLIALTVLVLVLLVVFGPLLKVVGVIDWPWKFIFAPVWVPLVFLLLWAFGWALYWVALLAMLSFVRM